MQAPEGKSLEIKVELTPFRLWKIHDTMGLSLLNFHFSLLDDYSYEEPTFHRSENRLGFWYRLNSRFMLNIWFQIPIWVRYS